MRSTLQRLPACRECVRAWRRLTGGKPLRDKKRRTLVACSGGADSTALLLCLWAAAGEHLVAGHVVHDLRTQKEAEDDASAVRGLCERLGTPFIRSDVLVRFQPGNAEGQARRLRYEALARMAAGNRCRYVATGHQGDDQLETMLMRLMRGAGPRGLSGIMPKGMLEMQGTQAFVVRPMLGLTRTDAEQVCRAAGAAWREDATNADVSRWRARLRRDVIPILKDLRPDVTRRAAASASILREAAELIEQRGFSMVDDMNVDEGALVWRREWIESVGVGVLGEMLRLARRRLLGKCGADRFRARDVEAVARGLRDPDRRERVWEFAGMRVRLDREELSVDRADGDGAERRA